jgi:hypothetical protein
MSEQRPTTPAVQQSDTHQTTPGEGEPRKFAVGDLLAGRYRIVRELGEGGMGVVYLAHDEELGRDVALKAVRKGLDDPGQALARLKREASLQAGLNHPNIATLHDVVWADGVPTLVMELVEGGTLQDRLQDRRPLPVTEVLELAAQLAGALEAAHAKGVVHRDLKPANLKLTPEGRLKVLDFGLAVARSPGGTAEAGAAGGGPLSLPGAIMGTPAYMSPEQASGGTADQRADLWAFGCVLFEMLSRRRAFPGRSVAETLVAVLGGVPNWKAWPPSAPPRLRALVERCLRPLARRWQHVGDIRVELEDAAAAPASGAEGDEPPTGRPTRRRLLWTAAGAGLAAGLVGLGWGLGRRRSEPAAPGVEPAPQREGDLLLSDPNMVRFPRSSPDGRRLAFVSLEGPQTQVAVMDLNERGDGRFDVLTDRRDRGEAVDPCWSPDGARLYYYRMQNVPQGVYEVALQGGGRREALDPVVPGAAAPAALADGSLLVIRQGADGWSRLHRCWLDRGPEATRPLGEPFRLCLESAGDYIHLRLSRDGEEAVINARPKDEPRPGVFAVAVETAAAERLACQAEPGQVPVPSPDRDFVRYFERAGDLYRVVEAPRSGDGPARTLLTLTWRPLDIESDRDGDLFLTRVHSDEELLELSPQGGVTRVMGGGRGN